MTTASPPVPSKKRSLSKVVVADGHRLMIAGIRRTLAGSDDIEIVGEARSGASVLPVVRETWPDLVLVDLDLPEVDGFGCLERLRLHHPDVKVVMLAPDGDTAGIARAQRDGASGYVFKSVEPTDLVDAIRGAVDGISWQVLGPPEEDDDQPAREAGLTGREIAILKGVARGDSSKVIARADGVTEQAIKFHLTNIYRKLGVANRTQAARRAYQLGLIRLALLETA